MGSPKRIRRTLALRVSERKIGETIDPNSPGQRFATGWALFQSHGMIVENGLASVCAGDAVVAAGFLAANAAWNAHHYAVNWIDTQVSA